MQAKVIILMGSASDWAIMEKAAALLNEFEVPFEIQVLSAHRTPCEAAEFAQKAAENGAEVVIAAAGLAAHLAGVVAAHTVLPVIGVPVSSGALNGIDALLSTVQMPPGVPVAAVGINNAANAAVLALQIMAIHDHRLRQMLLKYKTDLRTKTLSAQTAIDRSKYAFCNNNVKI